MHRVLVGISMAALTLIIPMGSKKASAQEKANTPAYYTDTVRPILVQNCGKCHLQAAHKGGLSLETKASTMKGSRDGAVIVPGDPTDSMLVKLIRHEGPEDDPKPMPPNAPKISDADIAAIEQWIKAGAVMP